MKKGHNKEEKATIQNGPAELLSLLRSDPGFNELEAIRGLCARYLDEDGLSSKEPDDGGDEDECQGHDILPDDVTRDHFKDSEMVDRASAWARDFDAVMAYLQVLAVSSRKAHRSNARAKSAYPKDVPVFQMPDQMISYFRDRWEKLKCRYC